MNEYMGVIGTVMGILLGFLLSEYQRRNVIAKERREFRLKKLEETYLLLGEFHVVSAEIGIKVMSAASMGVESKFKGFKDYDQIGRLSLLVEFYVPELMEDVEYIKKNFSSLSESTINFYMRGGEDKSENIVTTVEINETCKVLAKVISEAKKKLAAVAKEVQESV